MAGYPNAMGQLAGGITYGLTGGTVLGNVITQTFSGTIGNDPWPYWNQNYFNTATYATTVNVNVWQGWNQQIEAQRAAQVAELERNYQPEQIRIAEAKERASALLLRFLSPEQRHAWNSTGLFVVQAAKHRYALFRTGPPRRLDARGLSYDTQYCIHTYGVPREDELLGFKLLLESNEAEFLKIANATRINVQAEARAA